jgi:hypothetical protein
MQTQRRIPSRVPTISRLWQRLTACQWFARMRWRVARALEKVGEGG